MSLNKLIIIFGIILVIFAGVVFFQFSSKPVKKTPLKNLSTISSTAYTTAPNTVIINNHSFKLLLAKTPKEQQTGLSGKTSLTTDQGMLFVFDKSEYHNFWMKNMKFPIDIIFINDDKVVYIEQNAQPPKSDTENPPLIGSGGATNRVLEINAGLSEKYNIKKGDFVKIQL